MKKILLVYIEPTPYIIELINTIVPLCPAEIDILFLKQNHSQNWDLSLKKEWLTLPTGIINKTKFLLKIARNKYQMIHLAGWAEKWCLIFLFLAKISRIPVTIESDTPAPPITSGWKTWIKNRYYPRLFKLVDLFLPGGIRQADYIKSFSVASHRIIPVQMTVDVKSIAQQVQNLEAIDYLNFKEKYNLQSHHVVFLYVGRLEPHKGLHDLITAFNNLKHPDAKLIIVGNGILKEKIIESTLTNPSIYYAGRLSGLDLTRAYAIADVLVLPSHFEPWGLVINEAMAAGLPVIVSDRVGCIDDLVIEGETGCITKATDVNELTQALNFLASSKEVRLKMGKNAAQLISSWTLENEANKICAAWDGLVKFT